jgi:hypothetical protein
MGRGRIGLDRILVNTAREARAKAREGFNIDEIVVETASLRHYFFDC